MSRLKKNCASGKLSRECRAWMSNGASCGSKYVSLSKIKKMSSSCNIDVDVATVCSRLQALRVAESGRYVELRRELEGELYPHPDMSVDVVKGRIVGRRLGMTAGEVVQLFETVGVLSPLVFKARISVRAGECVSKLGTKRKRQKRAGY